MKALAKSALCALYKYSGAMRAQEALARRHGRSFTAVLLLHRVTDAIPEDGLTVSTAYFRRLCRLLRRSFRVVPLAEIFRLAQSGEPAPRRTVAVTFDDCYYDNLPASRVLAEHGLPACFFIPTAYVGTDHVFPWDRGLPRMPNLTWEDVRAIAALGHEIGSHTVTHADMAAAHEEQARHELAESRRTLQERLGRPVRWFAFPFGGPEHCPAGRWPLVREVGYEGCVSASSGFVRPGRESFLLPRVAVPDFKSSLLQLELYLSGCLDWFYRHKRGRQNDSSAREPMKQPAQVRA
jgi:hypothetical protein